MAGRPREFDRDEALRRARDLFWRRGYEATSMAELVDALGLASARLYAAFGSKEAMFREAIELYASGEGGFASRALNEEPTARAAIERILIEAIKLYTGPGEPRGCMVVSAATNCSPASEHVRDWLAQHRRERKASIVSRIEQAVRSGELAETTDPQVLGDFFGVVLHGLSVQARDGVPAERLLALVPVALAVLDGSIGLPAASTSTFLAPPDKS